MKKLLAIILGAAMLMPAALTPASAAAPGHSEISVAAETFSRRYTYSADEVKALEERYAGEGKDPGIYIHVLTMSATNDGRFYMTPAYYLDGDAMVWNSYDMREGEMSLRINGASSPYGTDCLIYNGYTLVPAAMFADCGCAIDYDPELYLTTISDGSTTLELMPTLLGMRKNKEAGEWIPLHTVARYRNDVLYVPLRDVAEALGMTVGWEDASSLVTLDF